MKKSRFVLALLFVSLLFVLLPAIANGNASMWDVPVGPGESFRWVFVTSTKTDATSTDIGYYNNFVNAAADAAGTPISGVVGKSSIADIEWKAIASTLATDAIDNIGPSMVPIYNPMGVGDLVAEGTTDMFDGILVNPILYTEAGDYAGVDVWTGSAVDGTGTPGLTLGGETMNTVIGVPWFRTGRWLFWTQFPSDYTSSIYSISEELTVVPVPGALMLAATGLLSSLGLKRWRRKHQEPIQI